MRRNILKKVIYGILISFVLYIVYVVLRLIISVNIAFHEEKPIINYPSSFFNDSIVMAFNPIRQYVNDDEDKLTVYKADSVYIIIWELSIDEVRSIKNCIFEEYNEHHKSDGYAYVNVPLLDNPIVGMANRVYAIKSNPYISYKSKNALNNYANKSDNHVYIQDSISQIYINYSSDMLDNEIAMNNTSITQLLIIAGQGKLYTIMAIPSKGFLKNDSPCLLDLMNVNEFASYKNPYIQLK